ncbi:HalOD1 output domain-containing protein [Haloterrigena salinisoli]|uniref:HalOD1 output domain-containing protein n=1 Tax=Haloterrigena salinisoli TaxID=3132747 RepID=UPI0030D1E728
MDNRRSRPHWESTPRRTEDEIIVDVVQALATADRLDLDEVEYTLYEHINPAVLTELAAHDGGCWEFTFEIADHEVTLTSDGRLFVDGVLCRDDLALQRPSSPPAYG